MSRETTIGPGVPTYAARPGNHLLKRGLVWWLCGIAVVLASSSCSEVTNGRGLGLPIPSDSTGSSPAFPSDGPDCGVGSVHPTNAPFCYPLPAGFTDFSFLQTYAPAWDYKSLVSITDEDLITVLAEDLRQDSDTATAHQRQVWFASQRVVVGQSGVTKVGVVRPTTVDGATATEQDAITSSGVHLHVVAVLRGRTIVNLHCEWVQDRDAVERACEQVIANIKIVSL